MIRPYMLNFRALWLHLSKKNGNVYGTIDFYTFFGGRDGHLGEGGGGREGHMGEGGTFKGGGRDIWGRGGKEGHLVGYLVDTSRAGCSYVV